jgi:hypothetical protein
MNGKTTDDLLLYKSSANEPAKFISFENITEYGKAHMRIIDDPQHFYFEKGRISGILDWTKRSSRSFEDCKNLCMSNPKCIGIHHHNGTCHYYNKEDVTWTVDPSLVNSQWSLKLPFEY